MESSAELHFLFSVYPCSVFTSSGLSGGVFYVVHFAADQGVICTAISTVEDAGNVDPVERWTSCNDDIQLMPMARSRILYMYVMEEGVGYTDFVVCTIFDHSHSSSLCQNVQDSWVMRCVIWTSVWQSECQIVRIYQIFDRKTWWIRLWESKFSIEKSTLPVTP